MPDASNATKSRLESFIQNCSQLQEIYAVAPLTYTDIVGEWWQRINDIIYTLGLTETESIPVNIAWTVPEIGRKRSPFFEEALATRTADGTEVAEEDRVSTVADDGTGKTGSHKYGLIQSIDKLFQRNIDTWGPLYGYVHLADASAQNPDGRLFSNLAQCLFGDAEADAVQISDAWDGATRNLTGTSKGLANSLKHLIEDVLGSDLYNWLDRLSNVEGDRPDGLQEFLFGSDADTDYSTVWGGLTTGGLATETVKLIETLGTDLYDWLNLQSKTCTVESSEKYYDIYKCNASGVWSAAAGETGYGFGGSFTGESYVPILRDGNNDPIEYSTTGNVVKQAVYSAFAARATDILRAGRPNPDLKDIACVTQKVHVNDGLDHPYITTRSAFYKCTAKAVMGTNGTVATHAVWSEIPSSYGNAVAGAYSAAEEALPSDRKWEGAMCLVERVEPDFSETDHSPLTLQELLFGKDAANQLCDIYSKLDSGSILGETQRIKDAIGEDLIDFLSEDPVCISQDSSAKPGPRSLKELLFGNVSEEEFCQRIKAIPGQSIIGEITNITNYLGPSYQQYIQNNSYYDYSESSALADAPDPAANPMTVLYSMLSGQVLYGNRKRGAAVSSDTQAYKADYIVGTAYICDTFSEAVATRDALTDQKRMFDTYQRVAFTGVGTALPPLDSSGGTTADTIYYWNDSVPFATLDAFKTAVTGGSWPTAYTHMGAQTNGRLNTPNLQIFNCCESRWYCLLENSAGTEICQDVRNGAEVGTGSMICRRNSNDSNLNYAKGLLIKSWTVSSGRDAGRRVFAFASNATTLTKAWTVKHAGAVYKSGNSWKVCAVDDVIPANTVVYASVIFCIEYVDYSGVGIELVSETYKCYAKKYESFEYYWNMAMLPRWWNDDAYVNNEYRNHFVYPKRSIFNKSPSILAPLGIQEQPFSNGDPVDSLSWVYDETKKLVFMGCNSIAWTGFLSNKKFDRYIFKTTANSDTDDDDGTGIIIGGYKDQNTGIVNTLSLSRTYSGETSFDFRINYGADSAQIFNINATNTGNTTLYKYYVAGNNGRTLTNFNVPNIFGDFKMRHLNGRYGGYTKDGTTEFVKKTYTGGTAEYIVCDPEALGGTKEAGYYDTGYGVNFARSEAFYNRTKTVYKPSYRNTGPSTINPVSIAIGGTTYTYHPYTETKNGRRVVGNASKEATNKWLDVKKTVQMVLDILKHNGLIFGRVGCADDKTNMGTYVLDVQHILPFHTGTNFSAWWDRASDKNPICDATKTGILNAIKYVFRKKSNGAVPTDAEALAILQYDIFPKYQLTTLTYKDLKLDDLFKLYHAGSRIYGGDPANDCFQSKYAINLGYIQGYGYLNAYTPDSTAAAPKPNLNDRYIVDRRPDYLHITYRDVLHGVDGRTNLSDAGVTYINSRHKYRGDIDIVIEYNPDEAFKTMTMTVTQGTTTANTNKVVKTYSIASRKLTVSVTGPNRSDTYEYTLASDEPNDVLGDPRLVKMIHEPTGYGYIGCSNPLTNFVDNQFVDPNNATIYELETNKIFALNDENEYTYIQNMNSTDVIYERFGTGRILSNDITGKLYYTRGDANQVQKLVEGGTGTTVVSSGGNAYAYYDMLKADILSTVRSEMYGGGGAVGEDHEEEEDPENLPVTAGEIAGMQTEFEDLLNQYRAEEAERIEGMVTDAFNASIEALPSNLADNKTIVATSSGKLRVDPTNATAGQKAVINSALVDTESGLAVDPETGRVQVDFSQMPTVKFEELLSGLRMQVPLDQNLSLYVDANSENADDVIVEGRGTAALPFKTLSACLDYATQKYAIGSHIVTIRLKEGEYLLPQMIQLSDVNRTTGSFYIVSEDGYGRAVIGNSSPQNTLFEFLGGTWRFVGVKFNLQTTDPGDSLPHNPACIIALYGSDIFIESCQFVAKYLGEARDRTSVRGIAVDLQSNLYIVPNNLGPTTFEIDSGNASLSSRSCALYIAENSHLYLTSTNEAETTSEAYKILFAGKMKEVLYVSASSSATFWGGGLYYGSFGTISGKTLSAQSYSVNGGSHVSFGSISTLPGSEGYVDTQTYSWYI